jgi:hypothetical protein
VTKVIQRVGTATLLWLLLAGVSAFAETTEPAKTEPAFKPAQLLYTQLRTVGLSKARVYRVRDASFNRGAVHITLDDGVIAFTEDVAGHVTGGFFEGEGEVLVAPPDQAERASMMLFTGAAILEERFFTAYFRFNDDTYTELMASLRDTSDVESFVGRWNVSAQNLASADALRLLLTFSRSLPVAANAALSDPVTALPEDHYLHARLQGEKLGVFDVVYDSTAAEQVLVGQLKSSDAGTFYDLWTSFAATRPGTAHEALNAVTEEGKSGDLLISGYKIRADVHPPTDLNADVSMQALVRQGGQRTVIFELSRFLQIKQIDADGQPLEFIHNEALEGSRRARLGNDLVALIFPRSLKAGQKLNLHFVYGGEVLSEAGNGLLYVGARGTWYPNRGLAMADFDLEFHTPPGWTLLATGKRSDISSTPQAAAEQVTHWVSERPIPVAGFNLGRYTRAVAHEGDTQVEAYAATGVERAFPKPPEQAVVQAPFPPGGIARSSPPPIGIIPPPPSPARNVQTVADGAAHALQFYEKRFGPYPYSALAVTQIPGALSQSWPQLIFLSSFSFLNPVERQQLRMPPVDLILTQNVVNHETAHQWWGDLVGWSTYRDQWISEALANYSALMLLESENPEQFRAVMEKYRQDLLEKSKAGNQLLEAGPVTLGSRLSSSHFPDGYEAISYGRGTWLFHMLRSMMRDANARKTRVSSVGTDEEPFIRALRKLRERYAGKSITTRDLLQAFEEELPPSLWYEGHKSLDWFYQGWVNGTALPHFDLQSVKYTDKAGSTVVSGSIVQKFSPKDLITPVPLYAVLGNKAIFVGQVFVDGPESPFQFKAPLGSRKLVLDPSGTLLTRR